MRAWLKRDCRWGNNDFHPKGTEVDIIGQTFHFMKLCFQILIPSSPEIKDRIADSEIEITFEEPIK